MKRFWEHATAAPQPGGGFAVLLDGRPLRLPGGGALQVAGAALAQALATEWNAAGGGAKGAEMAPEEVPLTRLLGTAQDRIAPDPAPVAAALARYAETDLLCYRADDPALAGLQAREWQPLLDWAARDLDAPLRATVGVMPVAQDTAALAALHRAVAALAPPTLAALGVAVPALGSLVLGLALARGRLDPAEASRLAALDETFQESRWGVDSEAAARRRHLAGEVALAARLIELARSER